MVVADKPLLPSLDLVRKTVAIELSYTLSRMCVLKRIPGNPVGIAYRPLSDTATALMSKNLPSPSFNTVVGLNAGDERFLEPVAAWYRENGVKPRFELVPGLASRDLALELARLGYVQSSFHISMMGAPTTIEPAPPPEVTVETVASESDMEDYLAAYVEGWGFPPEHREPFKKNVRPWREQPGWSLFLGMIDDEPAAAATLYVENGFAYCADAATAPQFRRRGLQRALLAQRLRVAEDRGAKVVFSGAEFLSASHRNMSRAGMELQFTRAIWTAVK